MRVHKLNNVEKAMGLLEKNNVSLNNWFTNKLNNLNKAILQLWAWCPSL